MSRRIVTTQLQASGGVRVDSYFDKVMKYIPADIVAAWIATTGIINSASTKMPQATVLWIAFASGLVLTALWTWKQTSETDKPLAATQILISTTAFAVWVFALGGPFENLGWYDSSYGALGLIFYTLVVGLITPAE
ncbi:hypothetical protein [Candidatus Venteria ishoeyi]|uniref:Uncharacterized protein n=1 Tax=Candidatus Venteria ishoeyi TaxID=1899563 RepID=A0A1H6F859_9GAMM|nr:hypothetical protein [Candidatus Venteria ishoeyi]SEH06317.1 Uncharacterised protein [Candidatus Venteria ishoeyi]